MLMKMQATVVGIQRSKGSGNIDGAERSWDSTKVHVHQDLADKHGNGRGQSTVSFKIGTSDEFAKLEKITLPCMFEFDIRKTTNGKGLSTDEVVGYRALPTEVKTAKAA